MEKATRNSREDTSEVCAGSSATPRASARAAPNCNGTGAAAAYNTKMDGSPMSAKPRPISQRKIEANRRNAQRSPGPRTAEGKARSRCNALRHGLRSEKVLFGCNRIPTDPELNDLYESLQKHGHDRAEADELARSVVIEMSRQRRAMEFEEICLQSIRDGSSAPVSLDHLHRYRTNSRRALLRHLTELRRRDGVQRD